MTGCSSGSPKPPSRPRTSGFDSFWVMDHYHQIGNMGKPTEPMLEAYTILSAVAARTSRIKLGAMVTGVTYRNPAFLAKVVTTLDIVSSGRAILGIGAAWNEDESLAYGYDWPPVAERFERLEDALQICRSMFTQPESTFQGTVTMWTGALNIPQPVQPGGPKILIGGGGERKTLRLVARYADMWNGFGDPETSPAQGRGAGRALRDVGRDPSEIVKTRLGGRRVADQGRADRRGWPTRGRAGSDDDASAMLTGATRTRRRAGLQQYLDAGLDGLIFNMPRARPRRTLRSRERSSTERFGSG